MVSHAVSRADAALHVGITQHYADYQHQVTFFRGPSGITEPDREYLITEASRFILQGAGIGP
jgi:hypothetical protein